MTTPIKVTRSDVTNAAAVQVFAANKNAKFRELANVGTSPLFIGSDNTVSETTGHFIDPGQSIKFNAHNPPTGAVWVISGTNPTAVSALEY
jgi:hypothetical protein